MTPADNAPTSYKCTQCGATFKARVQGPTTCPICGNRCGPTTCPLLEASDEGY